VPPYAIRLAPPAARQMRKLDAADLWRLRPHIDDLAHDPHPISARKLAGHASLCRIRVGDLRVVYQVDDDRAEVLVLAVGHRRDIYRDLQRLLRG
jgi:mRNA interferase RelE/StbE